MRRSRTPLILLAIAAFVLLVATLPAQTLAGGWADMHFGEELPLLDLGDVDGDGFDDVVQRLSTPTVVPFAGGFEVRSGVDRTMVYRVEGTQPDQALGGSFSRVGDLDGDGAPEILAQGGYHGLASFFPPHWLVYSGRTGALLFESTWTVFGHNPRARGFPVGDQDLDGIPDFLVQWSNGNPLRLISGADGTMLREYPSSLHLYSGFAVPDLDGDGRPEFVMGAQSGRAGYWGGVSCVSLASGTPIWKRLGTERNRPGGEIVRLGDQTGDGVDELLVPYLRYLVQPGGERRLAVTLDGATGATLGSKRIEPVDGLVHDLGDIDGDGARELGIVEVSERDPYLLDLVLLKQDLTFLARLFDRQVEYSTSNHLVDVGDLNGDGRDEFSSFSTGNSVSFHILGWTTPFLTGVLASGGTFYELTLVGATPHAPVALHLVEGPARSAVPGGLCPGVLAFATMPSLASELRVADAQGVVHAWLPTPPPALAGRMLVAIDLVGCIASNLHPVLP